MAILPPYTKPSWRACYRERASAFGLERLFVLASTVPSAARFWEEQGIRGRPEAWTQEEKEEVRGPAGIVVVGLFCPTGREVSKSVIYPTI